MPNELLPRQRPSTPERSNETLAQADDAMDHPLYQAVEASVFLPPWEAIASRIIEDGHGGDDVVIPRRLLRFFVRCLLDQTEFDELQYRKCNPGVAEAIRNREFASGRDHFLSVGYFEGRMGATPVQETWYLARNPDVAAAKQSGKLESGELQYRVAGAREWRAPNPMAVKWLAAWEDLLGKNSR
jgi:hypothetical protein